MAMMYGDIDKSREKRNDLNLIITNLTKVIAAWDTLNLMGEDDKDALEIQLMVMTHYSYL